MGNQNNKIKIEVDEMELEEREDITQQTKAVLEKMVDLQITAPQQHGNVIPPANSSDSQYCKYDFVSSEEQLRIFKKVQMQLHDPLNRPKFKHKRVPKASGFPPVPRMYSSQRPVNGKDMQDWKPPPNPPKEYKLPLVKGSAADGRGFQEVDGNFAKHTELLDIAEQKARKAIVMRSKVPGWETA